MVTGGTAAPRVLNTGGDRTYDRAGRSLPVTKLICRFYHNISKKLFYHRSAPGQTSIRALPSRTDRRRSLDRLCKEPYPSKSFTGTGPAGSPSLSAAISAGRAAFASRKHTFSARLEDLSARSEDFSARLEHLSARFENLSARFEHLSARLEHFSARLCHLSPR